MACPSCVNTKRPTSIPSCPNSFGFGGTNASLVFQQVQGLISLWEHNEIEKRRRKAPFIELFIEFFY